MILAEHTLLPIIDARFSPRAFLSSPLPEGTVELLFTAAGKSASGGNSQPWRFIYAQKDKNPEAFAKLAETLTGNNRLWAPSAPVLVAAIAQEETPEGRKIGAAHYDLGQAMAWLTVQATALGLFVHQMGGFDKVALREAFAIPNAFAPITVAAIGYIGRPDSLPADLHQKELVRSTRKPLLQIAGDGVFPV